MSLNALAIAALGICCAAWLMTAISLTLDLLGHPPFRRSTRGFRLQTAALLVMLTGAVLAQIAALRNWPRPLRETLDLLDVLLALAFLACVIIPPSIQSKSNRA